MKKLFSVAIIASLALGACDKNLNTSGAKDAAIDCAKQDLGQTVEAAGLSLLMTVASILFDGGDWQAKLEDLGIKYGIDAVKCAGNVAEALFRAPTDAPNLAKSTAESVESPHDRAVKFTAGAKFQ